MGFRYDTRHLSPEVQAIIRKRDEQDKISKQKIAGSYSAKTIKYFSSSLFIRLGINPYTGFDGDKTISEYLKFCNQNPSAWFSTDSLSTGMSAKKLKQYLDAISSGEILEIYFAIGKVGNGNNDIKYKAQVLDIKSNSIKMSSPDCTLTPHEWQGDERYIWIKIRNIQLSPLKAVDFQVVSTGNVLTNAIAHSQYHFGYIKSTKD